MRLSPIAHAPGAPYVVLRRDYLELVDGDRAAALILWMLEEWRRQSLNPPPLETPAPEWLRLPVRELHGQLGGLIGRDAIAAALERLVGLGLVERRQAGGDRAYRYRLDVNKVNLALQASPWSQEMAPVQKVENGSGVHSLKPGNLARERAHTHDTSSVVNVNSTANEGSRATDQLFNSEVDLDSNAYNSGRNKTRHAGGKSRPGDANVGKACGDPARGDRREGIEGTEKEGPDAVELVWRYWCERRQPRRRDLEPSQRKLIQRALNARFEVADLERAIDALLASDWHRARKLQQLSTIFATRPGGPTLRDQVEQWIERAPSPHASVRASSVARSPVITGRIAAAKDAVHMAAQMPGHRSAEKQAARARELLARHGITVQDGPDGRPLFKEAR